MRIVFMGTPEFAVPSLKILIEKGYDLAAAVTQPDRPKGRHGSVMAPPPVKELALQYGIKVLQPEKAGRHEFIQGLAGLKPDLLVTAAYGQILRKAVLDIPPMGCINVHGSLLPKYRGPAPIQWAVVNGDRETGVTTMFTDIGVDTGDMLLKKSIPIEADETAGMLHDRLAAAGAQALQETLEQLEKGTLKRIKQNDEEATYAPMLKKEMGEIDWNKTAGEVKNLVQGMDPWPGAFTFYKGERLRIWKVNTVGADDGVPGKVLSAGREGLVIACGQGGVSIEKLQPENGKRMSTAVYLAGHRVLAGNTFGRPPNGEGI